MVEKNRSSKKQRELLNYIDGFIKSNGYGPSYREVMRALDYRSVSTVAVHVDGLIKNGLLRKTDNSARSLEVIGEGTGVVTLPKQPESPHKDWLQKEIDKRTRLQNTKSSDSLQREIIVLKDAAQILGLGAIDSTGV
jgi:repressor LexA